MDSVTWYDHAVEFTIKGRTRRERLTLLTADEVTKRAVQSHGATGSTIAIRDKRSSAQPTGKCSHCGEWQRKSNFRGWSDCVNSCYAKGIAS
jgi:hypothetical protein